MFGIDDILGSIGDFAGGVSDLFNPATSSLYNGAANVASQAGSGIADFGSNLWGGISQNPWGALGGTLGAANQFGQLYMGMQNPQNTGGFDSGAQIQMQQPGGPTPQQLRRNIGDAQARGLAGASPDFMASMAGVTPQELDQMLGYHYGGPGAV